jgi:hypothetical protein
MSKHRLTARVAAAMAVAGIAIVIAGPSFSHGAKETMIKEALMAAPPSLAAVASVQDWGGNVLKQGSSSYVCLPRTPGSKFTDSMCLDAPWFAWADAWMNKTQFKADTVGLAYMLAEDGGASNTDPFAKGPAADNQWVVEGKHLMIIVPDPASLDGLSADPNSGGPYVMWKGTPYAHIMAPLD